MVAHVLLPAHAGMIPSHLMLLLTFFTAPRTRGDDPLDVLHIAVLHQLLPAHAGMIPGPATPRRRTGTAPRTRGDDPRKWLTRSVRRRCSPHTRG